MGCGGSVPVRANSTSAPLENEPPVSAPNIDGTGKESDNGVAEQNRNPPGFWSTLAEAWACDDWFSAAAEGEVDKLKRLAAQHPAFLDSLNEDDESALFIAAGEGHVECVRELLRLGASVNLVQKEDRVTALMQAIARECSIEMIEVFLEFGADIRLASAEGYTPLHVAAGLGHLESALLLLQEGADVGALNEDGCAPVFYAACNGHSELVACLFEAGADLNVKSRVDGQTAIFPAASNGFVEVLAFLLHAKAEVDLQCRTTKMTPLLNAAVNGKPASVALLIRAGADVNACTDEKSTALHLAAANGFPEILPLLARAGARLDVTDSDDLTPLMRAALMGQEACVRALVRLGADAGIRCPAGSAAEIAFREGYQRVVGILEWKEEEKEMGGEGDGDWEKDCLSSWQDVKSLIMSGAVLLWPLTVFRFLSEKNHPIPRRQDMPRVLESLGMDKDEIYENENAAKRCGEEGQFPFMGDFTVVCLSYGWLDSSHPDPDRFHLQQLVNETGRFWWAEGEHSARVFVFWDFASLSQKPRTPEEDKLFSSALQRLDVLYSSVHTRVFRSTGVPEGSLNSRPYDKRGWPTLETFVTAFKPHYLVHQMPVTLDPSNRERGRLSTLMQQTVITPVAPKEFDRIVEAKTFTNGADVEPVKNLYRSFVLRTAGTIRHISYSLRSCFKESDCRNLIGLFKFLISEKQISVESVELMGTPLSDRRLMQLVEALGPVESLKNLNLCRTQASRGTMQSLRKAIKAGGFASLRTLNLTSCDELDDNCLGDLISFLEFTQQREVKPLTLSIPDAGFSEEGFAVIRRKAQSLTDSFGASNIFLLTELGEFVPNLES
uniref:Uncharacterized protein n=1 Tax=Chromera velia CCMP2878 TaxID=1169474 RepID=A0A0G4I024_9ALVE|eukprot:Cvel_1616.t1-p1 / transcript=Cvel_1616.t1 / gene=Cvel_1616 / organism=Chromera_velia_CCMP2878 / gene_product=Ankyrin repeat domain-containing protein 17, putative / transcript_product=Ankyrin repeat domain-containing protein 17, putative / location=Cvel_scaffold57:149696-152903(+) / protein_length=837 / sequence_SO=supercontig / SO=protein_coding / is_pseudo=false